MIEQRDMAGRIKTLKQLMETKLGVKGKTLAHAVRRAGRRLPRRVRRQASVLVRAEAMAVNPKLARQLDRREIDLAYRDVTSHLKAIDVADERLGRMLSLAGAIAFNLLLIIAGFVAWLWWRGYV